MINVDCPKCGRHISVPEEFAGSNTTCPQCKFVFRVSDILSKEEKPSAPAGGMGGIPPPPPQFGRPAHAGFSPPVPDMRQPFGGAPYDAETPPRGDAGGLLTRITSGSTAGVALLAVILFFLPWIKMSCMNKEIISQSGHQIAMGKISYGPEIEEASKASEAQTSSCCQQDASNEVKKDWPLLALPLCFAVLAGLGVFSLVRPGSMESRFWGGAAVLSAAALLLIIIYLFAGFAIERQWAEQKEKMKTALKSNTCSTGGFEELNGQMTEMAEMATQSAGFERTTALHIFVICAVITFLLCVGTWVFLRKMDGPPPNISYM